MLLQQRVDHVGLGFDRPPPGADAAQQPPDAEKQVERALGRHDLQSRHILQPRRAKASASSRTQALPPVSAATAAAWLMLDGLVVDCDCSARIAVISSAGPPP